MPVWVKKCKKECKWKRSWNPGTYTGEKGIYAKNITDHSVNKWCEIIETTKSTQTKVVPASFNEIRWSVKLKIHIFYLPFYQLPWHYICRYICHIYVIIYVFSHYYAEIKVDSCTSLPLKATEFV